VDIGLVGDSKKTLNLLIPMLNKRHRKEDNYFLASKQSAMKKWESLLKEQGCRTDKPIKPQVIATAVSNELDDDAIISVDSGTNTIWAASYIFVHDKMTFSLSGTLATMGCGLPDAISAK
jgi:pyruvate dehydrogenase (quinone)/pyruvate oxidase